MKFARVAIPWRTKPLSMARLLESDELNYLQLDFDLPEKWQCSEDFKSNFDELLTAELLTQMKLVHKWLFLRPDFAVFTNGGGSHIVRCMESLAQFLVEHGSDELPIAAVRGTNLLSTIDPWLPAEIVNSGKKALMAQVEIGGGPLAIALAEGARIVVTGAYDQAAPLLASAVAGGEAHWHDFDWLAALAVSSGHCGSLTELHDGTVEVGQEFIPSKESLFADVIVDSSKFRLEASQRGTWQVAGVSGSASDSLWNLRVTLDAGFRAAVLIEEQANLVRDFCEESYPAETIEVEELLRVNRKDQPLSRAVLRGDSFVQCRQRLELLESWMAETGRTYVEPAPSIHQFTESVVVRIPSDEVTLSVDTRPAREWL